MDEDKEFTEEVKAHFAKLPKVVQRAITSADVGKQLRALAEKHKLHLDQWETLENEVQLTLMGVQPSEELAANIQSEVGLDSVVAQALAADISTIIFEPIRQELERQLEVPGAKPDETTVAEDAGAQVLEKAGSAPLAPSSEPMEERITLPPRPVGTTSPVTPNPVAPALAPVVPGTPPPPPPQGIAVRAPVSESYKAGETSSARKAVHDDPYREPPA